MTKQPADKLLVNGLVVTMNALGDIIPQGAVAIRGHDLVAVGATEEILEDIQNRPRRGRAPRAKL